MIKILNYDSKPITYIGKCAGTCYGTDTEDDFKNYKRGLQCIKDDHGRVLEYPSVTLEIDGYSVKAVREIYTHIIGTTRLQESTRYVNMNTRGYVMPPSVSKNKPAYHLFEEQMRMAFMTYNMLIDMGVPKEDASQVLPLALKTKFVLKINARALLHMANVRMCSRAYHEIRGMMADIKREIAQIDDEWDIISSMMVPKCEVAGYCTEHQSCGRKPKRESA